MKILSEKVEVTEENYLIVAAKHYNNPQCSSTDEFYADLDRIKYKAEKQGAYHQAIMGSASHDRREWFAFGGQAHQFPASSHRHLADRPDQAFAPSQPQLACRWQ